MYHVAVVVGVCKMSAFEEQRNRHFLQCFLIMGLILWYCLFAVKRLDDTVIREHKKHRHGSYNVVSSENNQKLTLKLSKNKDSHRGLLIISLLVLHSNIR
jgi:hypothetical protein